MSTLISQPANRLTIAPAVHLPLYIKFNALAKSKAKVFLHELWPFSKDNVILDLIYAGGTL